jgi:hypothetical protein
MYDRRVGVVVQIGKAPCSAHCDVQPGVPVQGGLCPCEKEGLFVTTCQRLSRKSSSTIEVLLTERSSVSFLTLCLTDYNSFLVWFCDGYIFMDLLNLCANLD